MPHKNLIIVGYARAGITILNRCLAGDNRLICLSEINSRYVCPTQPNTPQQQVKNWYNLNIDKREIMDEISEILSHTSVFDKILILRDWSFGSFVPSRYNNFTPTNTLNTVDDVSNKFPGKFETVCMVRHPADIWLSMRYSERTFYDKELSYLLKFTEDILKRKILIVKYEDFCKNPNEILNTIYKVINIDPPSKVVLSNNVIGDINYPTSSRGASLEQVTDLKRRNMTNEDYELLKKHTEVDKIAGLLGYKKI